MARYAIEDDRRQRLAEAQRAETKALREVTAAQRRRQHLQQKVDSADAELGEAHRVLVAVSGFDRAAHLSGDTPAELRRLLRCATQSSDEAKPADGPRRAAGIPDDSAPKEEPTT